MRVAVLAPLGARILEVVGPYDVFASAVRLDGQRARYRLAVLATAEKHVMGACGLQLIADGTINDADEAIDTLLVAGPYQPDQALADHDAISWVARRGPLVRRCAAICTGAFILAAAGLLDGRRATTHWRYGVSSEPARKSIVCAFARLRRTIDGIRPIGRT